MRSPPPESIMTLRRLRQIAEHARADYERQIDLCFEAGCRTFDIADAMGTSPQAVTMRRRKWRERGLMEEAVE